MGRRSATDRLRSQVELGRGGSGRLASMEGLRGLAVALVFLVHFSDLSAPWVESSPLTGAFAARVGNSGNIGVALFLVLSGFLIYGNLMDRPQAYRPYARRRLRRVYPTYLFVLALYVALSLALPSHSKLPSGAAAIVGAVIANVLLLPGIIPVAPIITVAWTLSYEVFFYLTVPLLISGLNLRERTSTWRVRLFVGLSAVTAVAGAAISGSHPRLAMFFAGMILWEWITSRSHEFTNNPQQAQRLDLAGLGALVVAVIAPMVLLSEIAGGGPRLIVLWVAWPVLCAACFCVDGRASRLFSWTPLRWLGNISFSYYLIHSLVLQGFFEAVRKVVDPTGQQAWVWWGLMIPAFVLTVGAALGLFIAVERRYSLAPSR